VTVRSEQSRNNYEFRGGACAPRPVGTVALLLSRLRLMTFSRQLLVGLSLGIVQLLWGRRDNQDGSYGNSWRFQFTTIYCVH